MNTREMATRLLALKALHDRIGAVLGDTRKLSAAVFDEPGQRDVGKVSGVPIGTVSVKNGAETWSITSPAKFLAWVRENVPDQVERVEQVKPEFAAQVLADCRSGEFAPGSVPAGVERLKRDPVVELKVAQGAGEVVTEALRSGELSLADVVTREIDRG